MWLFLTSRIGKIVSSVLAILTLIGTIFMAGRRDAKKDQKVKDLEDYQKTMERVHEVEASPDRNAALKRLRDNDQLR